MKVVIPITERCFGPGEVVLASEKEPVGERVLAPGEEIFWRTVGGVEYWLVNAQWFRPMRFFIVRSHASQLVQAHG